MRKLRYSERSLNEFNNLRELVSEFDNGAVQGTNYEEFDSAYDPNIDNTSRM